jgi:hypothetical protein
MSACHDRQFICGHCYGKFALHAALEHVSPFSANQLLRACPHCRTVIAEAHEMAELHLACSHNDCRQQPIGSDDNGWWCAAHQAP